MIKPKFKIGDLVYSDAYRIEEAIVIGLKAYSSSDLENFKDWKKNITNYEYVLLFEGGEVCLDECHLKVQKERIKNVK